MAALNPQIPVASKSSSAALAADLGGIYLIGGKKYMLVQAGAIDATPARRCYKFTLDANNSPIFSAVIASTANNDPNAFGVCDPAQVALAVGDYFLLQIGGVFQYISDAAIAAGAPIGSGAATAGRITSTTITLVGMLGISTSAPGGAGVTGYGYLVNRF